MDTVTKLSDSIIEKYPWRKTGERRIMLVIEHDGIVHHMDTNDPRGSSSRMIEFHSDTGQLVSTATERAMRYRVVNFVNTLRVTCSTCMSLRVRPITHSQVPAVNTSPRPRLK